MDILWLKCSSFLLCDVMLCGMFWAKLEAATTPPSLYVDNLSRCIITGETCTCVCLLHISPIVIVHPHRKSWKSAQQSSRYHRCSFSLGFTVTSHIPDFITTLISLYFMNINFFHIHFSLVSLDLLFPPVWEPFHGTLYHKSVLTPALPPMHCILIKALSMNWCCTQTSAILVVYWISSHSKSWYSSSLRNILLGLYSCNYSLRSGLYLTSDTIHV